MIVKNITIIADSRQFCNQEFAMITEQPPTARPPFDHALSARIDSLVIQLDAQPSAPIRWWLKTKKRYWERKIPPAIAPCCRCGDANGFLPLDPAGLALCESCFEVQR